MAGFGELNGDFRIQFDRVYRRHQRIILIASAESVAPKDDARFDPRIWGGGNGDFTWGRVQRYYASLPETVARNHMMPMHYYMEFISTATYDDFVIYVGSPLSNRSWWLQSAVAAGVLPVEYADAVLVVIQENYNRETVDQRLWTMLADRLLTPLVRLLPPMQIRTSVRFYELEADAEAARSPGWPWRLSAPRYLDPFQLQMALKIYEKR